MSLRAVLAQDTYGGPRTQGLPPTISAPPGGSAYAPSGAAYDAMVAAFAAQNATGFAYVTNSEAMRKTAADGDGALVAGNEVGFLNDDLEPRVVAAAAISTVDGQKPTLGTLGGVECLLFDGNASISGNDRLETELVDPPSTFTYIILGRLRSTTEANQTLVETRYFRIQAQFTGFSGPTFRHGAGHEEFGVSSMLNTWTLLVLQGNISSNEFRLWSPERSGWLEGTVSSWMNNGPTGLIGRNSYEPTNGAPADCGIRAAIYANTWNFTTAQLQDLVDRALEDGPAITAIVPAIPVVAPPSTGVGVTIPNAVNTVNVSNNTQLTAAIAAANSSVCTHIVLADGTYTGARTIDNGGSSTTAPLVIRAANPQQAVITGLWIVASQHVTLYQLSFGAGGQVVGRNCSNFRYLRCYKTGSSGRWEFLGNSNDIEIAYSTFENTNTGDRLLDFRQRDPDFPGVQLRPWCHHNYFLRSNKDNNIATGISFRTSNTDVYGIFEYNLFENCSGTGIYLKSANNVVRFNTRKGSQSGSAYVANCRHSRDNQLIANVAIDNSRGCVSRGDNNLLLGNYYDGSSGHSTYNSHMVATGDCTEAQFITGVGGRPRADSTRVIGNIGPLWVGGDNSTNTFPALDTLIENHTGGPITIDTNALAGGNGPRAVGTIDRRNQPPSVEVPPYVILTSDQVGINADLGATGVTPEQLRLNPFNKLAAHHRPAGASVQYGIPAQYNYLTRALEVSAAVGTRGRIANVQAGHYTFKLQGNKLRKPTLSNATSISGSTRTITGSGTGLPVTLRMPSGTGLENYVAPTTDNNPGVFDIAESSNRTPGWHHLFFQYDNDASTAGGCRIYPLDGLDYPSSADTGDRGTSASSVRWPSGVLRDFEIMPTSPDPIQHIFQAAATRIGTAANHLLSKHITWPAFSRDSSAGDSAQNLGQYPYGTRLILRETDYDFLLANFTWTARQRVIIDQQRYYGTLLLDGTSRDDGGGVCQLRADLGITDAVFDEIQVALDEVVKYLWPVANTRGYTTETEVWTDGLPYAGGGGPIDANSVNNAYDV